MIRQSKLFFCFLAISICSIFSGCQKTSLFTSKKTTLFDSSEGEWLDKFFTDIMLDGAAIYTLYGSKPMTLVILDLMTDEDIQFYIDQMTEEEKKELIFVEKSYDLPDNWEKWENIRSRYFISDFLFFKRERPKDPFCEDIYFINVPLAVQTIQEHYPIFRERVGHDFDSFEFVLQIGEKGSELWEKMDAVLYGILFGYGKTNAECFGRKYYYISNVGDDVKKIVEICNPCFSGEGEDYHDPSIQQFNIPTFASFSTPGEDPVVKKYKEEREKIQDIYKNKDFLNLTLKKLTSRE